MVDIKLIAESLLVLALFVRIVGRQLMWRVFDPSRAWKLPVILGGVGIAQIVLSKANLAVAGTAAVVLLLELIMSFGTGAVMGMLAQFRRPIEPTSPGWETRTGWIGLALWLVAIGLRIGGDLLIGAQVPASITVGLVMVMLAANRVGRIFVLLRRLELRTV